MMNDIKLPPNNKDAEESVLGSLIINGDCIEQVENKIKPGDFYFKNNQIIYSACIDLRSRHEAINIVTLAQELKRSGKLESIGGAGQLSYLVSVCGSTLDIEYYADIIYRLSVSRKLIVIGDRISAIGYQEEPEVGKTIDGVVKMITDFRREAVVYDELISPKNAADLLYDMANNIKQPHKAMSYGFKDIDNITSGIYPELIIIGARPSTGKTQIMLDIMENVALQDKKILFCTAEMSLRSLIERKVARELRVDIHSIRNGINDENIKQRMVDLSGKVSEQQVFYLPKGVSSGDIYNEALKLKNNIGLDIVFVDYLQILKDCWQSGRENKVVLVGRACKTLKSIVDDLQIPVICASQLNRDLERRGDDKRPVLADLRESGDIEQDADVVFLLWRNMTNIELGKTLEVKMAKNRQLGDASVVKLVWVAQDHCYADYYNQGENYG